MKLVIDTSILIDKLRGGNHWDKFVEEVDKDSLLYLPTIVVFELFSGQSTQDSEIVSKVIALSKFFQKLDLTWDIAQTAGEIYRDGIADLEIPDYIIAASALEIGATVVTLNTKHFSRIPRLSLYHF